MTKGVTVLAAVALMIGGTAACSSDHVRAKPEAGSLPPGTAQLALNGKSVGPAGAVRCVTVESTKTIAAGNDASGVTVMVSNPGPLTVEFVRIRSLNGFTGNYNRGLEGDAAITMTGATYDITGTALGYGPKSVERTTERFMMKISC